MRGRRARLSVAPLISLGRFGELVFVGGQLKKAVNLFIDGAGEIDQFRQSRRDLVKNAVGKFFFVDAIENALRSLKCAFSVMTRRVDTPGPLPCCCRCFVCHCRFPFGCP